MAVLGINATDKDPSYDWSAIKPTRQIDSRQALAEAIYNAVNLLVDHITDNGIAKWPAIYQLSQIAHLFTRNIPNAGDSLIEWIAENKSWLNENWDSARILDGLEETVQRNAELFPFDPAHCYCSVDGDVACWYCQARGVIREIPY